MPWSSSHTKWLVDTEQKLTTSDGKCVEVWEFCYEQNDDETMSKWARHFRNHYCDDAQIDILRGSSRSRTTYLNEIKLPDCSSKLGPGIRAGDFGEILIADFLEFILDFWVPRTRYVNKDIRDESKKGCDTIGFKFANDTEYSAKDILAVFETKTRFSRGGNSSRLQDAVNDSGKDQARRAESLNAIKQRLLGDHAKPGARRPC
jgi:hypothetical protein